MDSGPIFLSITQSVGLFGVFLPSFQDVRRADRNDPDFLQDVRLGEFAAISLCLGIGAVASSFAKSPVPMYAAALSALVLAGLYEYALQNGSVSNA